MTDDRRFHARVQVEVPCKIVGPKGSYDGTINDFSMSGALVEGTSDQAKPGEWLSLEIDVHDRGEPLTLLGQVLRVLKGTPPRYALRFEAADSVEHSRIQRFIAMQLQKEGGGERRGPRVAKRLNIQAVTTEEIQAVMQNLSRKGMGFTCDALISADQPVYVTVQARDEVLDLPGTVVHCQLTNDGQFQIGVRFGDLSDPQQRAVDALMQRLALA